MGAADTFIVNLREYLLIALMAKSGLERECLSKFPQVFPQKNSAFQYNPTMASH
jgi:hypothetical protein